MQAASPRTTGSTGVRPAARNVPQTAADRARMLQAARAYVARFNPVPPLPVEELQKHADRLLQEVNSDPIYRDYLSVLLNNEMWRETLASVPYNRRLLLLPKCLRSIEHCTASFDEFGLLCKRCGSCSLAALQEQAEALGYAVLVAEGSAVVMSLIQQRKIEAIIGVSCMSVLERAFPHMEAAAIPGIGIPLLQDDCAETSVDLEWVWDYIHLTDTDETRRLDLSALREEVDTWFSPEHLEQVMGPAHDKTEQIAREWLGLGGKRWRPLLAVATFRALAQKTPAQLPNKIRNIAVAVECFHKASLIHDDIEDSDQHRYGAKTLHAEYGVPFALNVGDLLIGEGYRLIATAELTPEQKSEMLLVAAQAQRNLCKGQGAELGWMRSPEPLSTQQVLDIFRGKTAPAFEVALQLGAICADAPETAAISKVLSAYSDALGVAYQIRDDLEDFECLRGGDIAAKRPTLLLALAAEQAAGEQKLLLEKLWQRSSGIQEITPAEIACIYTQLGVRQRASSMLESYKEEAIQSLRAVANPNLKGLLRRLIGKIFHDPEIAGWCKELRDPI